jgi:hypothetical protein
VLGLDAAGMKYKDFRGYTGPRLRGDDAILRVGQWPEMHFVDMLGQWELYKTCSLSGTAVAILMVRY